MADTLPSWTPRSAWSPAIANVERSHDAGLILTPRDDLAVASIIASGGRKQECLKALQDFAGVAAPEKPRAHFGPRAALVWAGPGEWLLVTPDPSLMSQLPAVLAGVAAMSDQSSGRAILRVEGPLVRDTLAKGLMIDLHPRAFAKGDAALTVANLIGVHIWQVDDAPVYDLAVTRSMAIDFWRWLVDSAGHSVEVREPT